MPSVIDTPERLEDVDVHDFQEERPQVCVTRSGFWQRLLQYVRGHRVHTASRMPPSSRASLHPTESPMARLAQEHPMLYLLGFCGIHSG
jgi:hypothetical protein